jgi:hypothetical protein
MPLCKRCGCDLGDDETYLCGWCDEEYDDEDYDE